MKAIGNALRELKQVLISISIVDSLIESLIVFLIMLLAFDQFEIKWQYAVIPAILYYIFRTIRLISKRNLVLVESAVPELKEKLRTVADYVGKSGPILDSLNKDVLKSMKQIKTSYFISFGGLIRKLGIMFIISILIIFISSLNVKLIDLQYLLDPLYDDDYGAYIISADNDSIVRDGDIYGEEEVVELGKNQLDLKLNLVASDINIEEFKEVQSKEFANNFPKDIGANADSSFEEDFSKEYKLVVKNYFSKISDKK